MTITSAPLLLALLIQDPTPSEAPVPPRDEFTLIDGVAAYVNDRAITLRELANQVDQERQRVSVTSMAELQELQAEQLQLMIDSTIMTQAGEDLGFPPEAIDRQTATFFDMETESRGFLGQATYLQQEGLSRISAEAELRERLYLNAWIRSQVGLDPAPQGRRVRQRHLRPGELRMAYEENLQLLGEPDEARLQQMVVTAAQAGGLQEARDFCEQVREDVESGRTDISEAIRLYSPFPEGNGVLPAMAVTQLPSELRIWMDEASPGDITPLVAFVDPSQPSEIAGWRFFRLLERIEGSPAPPFQEFAVQERLRQQLQQERDEQVLVYERLRFELDSEVWSRIQGPRRAPNTP